MDLITETHSDCGRYTILHKANSTHAQIIEYIGDAPRLIANRFEIPVALLTSFMANSNTVQFA